MKNKKRKILNYKEIPRKYTIYYDEFEQLTIKEIETEIAHTEREMHLLEKEEKALKGEIEYYSK